ncbi:hypothetical protein [Candidatus Frankia nodulisporulans]|nr:hypothetical protein [Candidatus Frankia nodulisporulans]
MNAQRRALAVVGDANPTNRTCALCGAQTGGTGLICADCVTLPTPARTGR